MSVANDESNKSLISELLAKYKEADDEVTRIKALLDTANKKRSDVVKELDAKIGKGPYTYKGEFLGKIIVRNFTYFFRSLKKDTMISID